MNKPKNYHTDPLFNELKIMKIKDLEHFESSKLTYCIKEKLLPPPITKMFHTYGKKNHSYITRNKELPNIKKHKSDSYNKSFLCKSLHNFSTLKKEIQMSKSKKRICEFLQKTSLQYRTLSCNQMKISSSLYICDGNAEII